MFGGLYSRYVAASATSLGVDVALFMICLALRVPPAAAASIGYLAGVICNWLLSSRAVFVGRIAETTAGRRQQQALFLGSALVGLAVTAAIVGAAARLGFDPRLAKSVAVVISFQTTYIVRRKVIFR